MIRDLILCEGGSIFLYRFLNPNNIQIWVGGSMCFRKVAVQISNRKNAT